MATLVRIIVVVVILFHAATTLGSEPSISEATQECLDCHAVFHPGIVEGVKPGPCHVLGGGSAGQERAEDDGRLQHHKWRPVPRPSLRGFGSHRVDRQHPAVAQHPGDGTGNRKIY